MLGCLIFSSSFRRVRCEERIICGGRFCCALLPENPKDRQIRKAARLLKKRGISRAVFPPDQCERQRWKRYGIEPMEGPAFRRRLLPRILSWALEGTDCERAGICAQRVDFEVQRAAELLVRRCRYLCFDCGRETVRLAAELRREWGVAAITEPTAKQLADCDVLVLFVPREDLSCRGRVLPFYEGAGIPWRYRFCGREEPGFAADPEQLGAALWAMGILRAKDVEIF